MPTGFVKWYYVKEGYGYIIPDDQGPEIFVHASELRTGEPLDEGQRVRYELQMSPKGPIARAVQPCPE